MKKLLLLLTCVSALPITASAEPSVLPLSLQHKFAIEASTGWGNGNIDNQRYKVGGKLTSTHERYSNELKADYANVEKAHGGDEGLYNVGDKLKYAITDHNYTFGELDYNANQAAGINRRTSELVGYGHQLIKQDNFDLTGELGAGLRQSDYKPGLKGEDSYLGKVGTDMNWGIYNNVNLNNNTYMAFTDDNTQTVSDTSLKIPVYEGAYVKGGVSVENNSDVPTNYKKTDTVSSVGVGYEF